MKCKREHQRWAVTFSMLIFLHLSCSLSPSRFSKSDKFINQKYTTNSIFVNLEAKRNENCVPNKTKQNRENYKRKDIMKNESICMFVFLFRFYCWTFINFLVECRYREKQTKSVCIQILLLYGSFRSLFCEKRVCVTPFISIIIK